MIEFATFHVIASKSTSSTFEEEPLCSFVVVVLTYSLFLITVSCPCYITATDAAASTFSPWARSLVTAQGRLLLRMQVHVGWTAIVREPMLLLTNGWLAFAQGQVLCRQWSSG